MFHFDLKGTISDRPFRTSLFSKPPHFCIFRENYTVVTYLYNNSLGDSTYLERETMLCCGELTIASDNQIKLVFSDFGGKMVHVVIDMYFFFIYKGFEDSS